MTQTHSIYKYSHYQHFLRDYVEARKGAHGTWSYGVWARQLKLKSSSTLIMIVNGQRNPGPRLISKLCEFFKFNKQETDYFASLVLLQKTKNIADTIALLEQLQQKNPDVRLLDLANFRAISHWYYYAIRELVTQQTFIEDYEWIAKYFSRKISAAQAKEAIDSLLRLGLLVRDMSGVLQVEQKYFETPHDIADEALRKFHYEVLALAQQSIENTSNKLREISGGTFAVQKKHLPKAKKLIRKFQMDLCQLLETKQGDAIYQLEVAFFPLSEIQEDGL